MSFSHDILTGTKEHIRAELPDCCTVITMEPSPGFTHGMIRVFSPVGLAADVNMGLDLVRVVVDRPDSANRHTTMIEYADPGMLDQLVRALRRLWVFGGLMRSGGSKG